jgi:tRNA A37 N6-isopentenylltransferase MiaA
LLGAQKRPPFRLIEIGLAPSDRSELHRRIEVRFDTMLKMVLPTNCAPWVSPGIPDAFDRWQEKLGKA